MCFSRVGAEILTDCILKLEEEQTEELAEGTKLLQPTAETIAS